MTSWHSLYLPCDDSARIIGALQNSLTTLGYTLFNPFGLIPGKAYPKAVRLFVAPTVGGWVRVLGEPDPALLPLISQFNPCAAVSLDGGQSALALYAEGRTVGPEAFQAYLRCDLDTVRGLIEREDAPDAPQSTDGLPFDALSGDLQQMAGNVDMRQAQNMFSRLTGNLMKRVGGGDDADAARSLLAGNQPAWDSAGGQRIRAFMRCLTVPQGWQSPDFVSLRDAYQLHERRRRNPNANLYPGDAETMAQVTNALDYTPVYGGMSV
jgi:hypothetical protein